MSSRVPRQISQDVLIRWIQGVRRDEIARTVGIGAGTVSEIVKDYRDNDSDFDRIREYVLSLIKNGKNVAQLVSANRLDNRLEKLHVSPEQIELFLDNLGEFCFKRRLLPEQFVKNVNEVSELSSKSRIPIEALPDHIREKQNEVSSLGWEIIFKKIEREKKLREYNLTEIQLQEFIETGTMERLRSSEGALAVITKQRNDAYMEICRLKVRLNLAEYAKNLVLDELVKKTNRKITTDNENENRN
jgi:hypothetical protein